MAHADRRRAHRYRVPAHARLWWEGSSGVAAAVSNVSATGCRFEGEVMPRLGEPVWVALTMAGLPDLRLPAKAVRESAGPDGTPRAAVRFNIPTDRVSGLELLLLQRLQEQNGQGVILIVEPDAQARERMLKTVRQGGELCLGVSAPEEVARIVTWLRIDTILTRAHQEGLSTLLTLGARLPSARRAILGTSEAAVNLHAHGQVDLILDDEVKAPGLHKALDRWRGRAPVRHSKS